MIGTQYICSSWSMPEAYGGAILSSRLFLCSSVFPHPALAGTSASGSNDIRNDAPVTIEQNDGQSLDACSAVVSMELHAEKRGPCVFPHRKG